ncbi:MAG: YeeE/YedE thiosulfate transporter family protein [Gammaproteobacteria bacterium]
MSLLWLSAILAFALGFSAYRASICTVAAVAEVMSSRTGRVFLSFAKVVGWVLLVNGLLVWWMPDLARPVKPQPGLLMALIGGLVFGIGAAVNGGCGFSTISKIAQGNIHMAMTLPAFVIGVSAGAVLLAWIDTGASLTTPWVGEQTGLVLLLLLGLWGVWEIVEIIGPNLRGDGIWRGISAGRYRLSTGAAIVGICSGGIYALHGRWAYSSQLVDAFIERPGLPSAEGHIAGWLFLALLAGAIVSAVSNRQFSFSFDKDMWLRNLIGGFLMGAGAMLVPGGNAALILQDLPTLSVHAIVAYLAMILGIGMTLMLFRRVTGASMTVSCGGDLCSVDKTRATTRRS